jgi:hypothetical protein
MAESETQKNILIVTGNFNEDAGKSSHFGIQIYNTFDIYFRGNDRYKIEFINGGNISALKDCAYNIKNYKIVFWMPHIHEMANPPVYGDSGIAINKFAQAIKLENPTALFIQAKRNDYNRYTTFEIIQGMLEIHANLCFVISKDESDYTFKIYDPLGNLWYSGSNIICAAERMAEFTRQLSTLIRVPSKGDLPISLDEARVVEDKFMDAVRFYGWRFSTLINEEINKERYLGNASTRCMLGFPSIRNKSAILISKRNIDKQVIEAEDFVPVTMDESGLHYAWLNKPSVDAAIQVKLYEYYHNVKYIIHGHAYVTLARTTGKYIPCGYIEEVEEITKLFKDHLSCNFAVNLIGHGCVILAKDINFFAGLGLVPRSIPEDFTSYLDKIL